MAAEWFTPAWINGKPDQPHPTGNCPVIPGSELQPPNRAAGSPTEADYLQGSSGGGKSGHLLLLLPSKEDNVKQETHP